MAAVLQPSASPSSVVPIATIRPMALINGTRVPIMKFDCQTGAYGSVGRFTFTTAISALAGAGFSAKTAKGLLHDYAANAQPSQADGSPCLPIQITCNGAYGQPQQVIFGGDLDALDWDFDNDMLTVEGRDYSGRLADWKLVLDAGLAHMTPTKFASYVAGKMGLTISIPSPVSSAVTVGQLQNAQEDQAELGSYLYDAGQSGTPGVVNPLASSFNPAIWSTPKEVWSLLNFLARALGWVVHTLPGTSSSGQPTGILYFGPPEYTQTAPRIFTYRANSQTPNVIPVRDLKILHQPHRYGTFKVLVMSYHNPTLYMTTATAVHVQAGFTTPAAQLVKAGVYTNANALASAVENGKPNYIYYIPGLGKDQVQQVSQAVTFDLAKRLYTVGGEIDGDPTLLPQMPIELAEAVPGCLQGYAGVSLNAASVNHVYDMSNGYRTKFKAWYAPPGPTEYNVQPITDF